MRLLFLLLLAFPVYADTHIEIGPSYMSYKKAGTFVFVEERIAYFGFGVGYVSEQDFTDASGVPATTDPNIFVSVNRYWDIGRVQVHLGPAYFQNKNRGLPRNLTIGVGIAYHYKRWSINVRHYSNAGSGGSEWVGDYPEGEFRSNLGQDAITLGYAF